MTISKLLSILAIISMICTTLMGMNVAPQLDSSTSDQAFSGALEGLAYRPAAGMWSIFSTYESLVSDSYFDAKEKEISYKDLFYALTYPNGLYFDPEVTTAVLVSGIHLGLTERFGLSARIPIILRQKMTYNSLSGVNIGISDPEGETGLADIHVGGWFRLWQKPGLQMILNGYYRLTTGSSPEDLDESNLSPTSEGQNAIRIGGAGDFQLPMGLFLGLSGDYTIFTETSMKLDTLTYSYFFQASPWVMSNMEFDGSNVDIQSGNLIAINGRLATNQMLPFAVGLDVHFLSSAETMLNGEDVADTDNWMTAVRPTVGYQLNLGTYNLNLQGSYYHTINGKSYDIFNGYRLAFRLLF